MSQQLVMLSNEIAGTGQELGFNEVASAIVQELLNLHDEKLSNYDPINADQQYAYELHSYRGKIILKSQINFPQFQHKF